MKKLLLSLCGFSFLFFSCEKDDNQSYGNEEELIIDAELVTIQSQEFLSIDEINAIIDESFATRRSFSWETVADNVLWSAAVHGQGMITVGYGEEGESFREGKNLRLDAIRNDIVSIVAGSEATSKTNLRLKEDEILNLVDIEVSSLATIKALRINPDVRYLEPNGYSFYVLKSGQGTQQRSSSGCDFGGESLASEDFRTVTPAARIPWTYDQHNITQAWSRSTGAGITVGVIDTGLSPEQPLMNAQFNDGASTGRTVQKYGTFIDSNWWWSNNIDGPNDRCGHGTSMTATIASPRNDNNLPVGVAYNSNLVSYRGTEDVLLNDYHERKGVSNALKALANRGDVKIISMSVGYPWSIGNVRDAVRYAHSRGKLIFAAGGTSLDFTNWYPVIFPASMSECVAVTGITDGNGYTQCDTCHDGSEIEFTVVMQRSGGNKKTSPVLGYYNGQNDYVGGSSVATATTAGIAALIWSKYPNWSRDQVLNRMRQSGELYPNRDGNYGYGNIDAYQAVQ